jgi:hypothetical protein
VQLRFRRHELLVCQSGDPTGVDQVGHGHEFLDACVIVPPGRLAALRSCVER